VSNTEKCFRQKTFFLKNENHFMTKTILHQNKRSISIAQMPSFE
jgi:hypothetical protein